MQNMTHQIISDVHGGWRIIGHGPWTFAWGSVGDWQRFLAPRVGAPGSGVHPPVGSSSGANTVGPGALLSLGGPYFWSPGDGILGSQKVLFLDAKK